MAGVSRASASRALLGQGKVTPETVRKVKDAAAKLGYVPNVAAKVLAGGVGNRFLGLIVRDSSNPAYSQLMECLQVEARAQNQHVITMSVANEVGEDMADSILQSMLGLGARGLIVATAAIDSRLLERYHATTPLLRAGTPELSPLLNSVTYDEGSHGRVIAEAIAAAGHRDVVVLTKTREEGLAQSLRADTMCRVFADHGVAVTRVEQGTPDERATRVVELVRGGATAVACSADSWALKVLGTLMEAGFAVPDDVSVTGIDGLMPGLDLIGLTTVRLPVEHLAVVAMQSALRMMDGTPGLVRASFEGSLVRRATLAAPPR